MDDTRESSHSIPVRSVQTTDGNLGDLGNPSMKSSLQKRKPGPGNWDTNVGETSDILYCTRIIHSTVLYSVGLIKTVDLHTAFLVGDCVACEVGAVPFLANTLAAETRAAAAEIPIGCVYLTGPRRVTTHCTVYMVLLCGRSAGREICSELVRESPRESSLDGTYSTASRLCCYGARMLVFLPFPLSPCAIIITICVSLRFFF